MIRGPQFNAASAVVLVCSMLTVTAAAAETQTGRNEEADELEISRLLDERQAQKAFFVAEQANVNRPAGSSAIARVKPTRIWSIEELQAQLLRRDDALVMFFLGRGRSICWIVQQSRLDVIFLPARSSIETAVTPYVSSLQEGTIDRTRGNRLLRLLLPDLVTRVPREDRLIVIPHGILDRLPFETLVDDEGHFLIETHPISYAASASEHALLRSRETDDSLRLPEAAVRPLAVVAGGRAVVTCLWSGVDDRASAAFTREFTRALGNDVAADRAAQQAKLTFIRDRDRAGLPGLWAPFVVSGDGTATAPPPWPVDPVLASRLLILAVTLVAGYAIVRWKKRPGRIRPDPLT